MIGFTYNGIHSSAFGLYYIPNHDELWFNDAEYETYEDDVDWKHGGYYYGSKAKNRTFTIKCYFEEIDVATRQAIKRWVKRGTSGRLIFDDMPFIYWNVRPGKIPVGNLYNDLNESNSGTVTLTFVAYEPFGYLIRKSNSAHADDDSASYVNFILTTDMPAVPTTSDTRFDVYNPGTEECGLSIELSGSTSNPIRFFNETNGTFCEFSSLPANNLHVAIDGETGYVSTFVGGASSYENGYAYHDKGVVKLSPNVGSSEVEYTYLGLNGTLHAFEIDGYQVESELVGATFTVDGVDAVFTVVSIYRGTNRIYCSVSGSVTIPATGNGRIKTVNKIAIQEKVNGSWTAPSTLSLNSISIDYVPRAL